MIHGMQLNLHGAVRVEVREDDRAKSNPQTLKVLVFDERGKALELLVYPERVDDVIQLDVPADYRREQVTT